MIKAAQKPETKRGLELGILLEYLSIQQGGTSYIMKIKFRSMVKVSITSFSRYFQKCHFFRSHAKIAILRKNFAISIKKEYSRDRTNPKPIIHTNFTHHTSFLLCFEDLNSKLEIFLNMDDMTHVPGHDVQKKISGVKKKINLEEGSNNKNIKQITVWLIPYR